MSGQTGKTGKTANATIARRQDAIARPTLSEVLA